MEIGDRINVIKPELRRNRIVRSTLLSLLMLGTFATTARSQRAAAVPPAAASLAGAVAARLESSMAGWLNPAAIDLTAPSTLLATTTPSPLGIDGLVESGLYADLAVASDLRAGISVAGYGERRYLESGISAGLAVRLTGRFQAGARVEIGMIAVEGYPYRISSSADLGACAELGDHLRVGVAILGLSGPASGVPAISPAVTIGVAADLDSTSILSVDLLQELGREPSLGIGFSWKPVEDWTLRTGFGTGPFRMAAGVGARVGDLAVDVGSVWFESVGLRHSFGAAIRL